MRPINDVGRWRRAAARRLQLAQYDRTVRQHAMAYTRMIDVALGRRHED